MPYLIEFIIIFQGSKMVEIKKINKEMLGRYSEIPISFEVKSILKMDLINNGLDGIRFLEEKYQSHFI